MSLLRRILLLIKGGAAKPTLPPAWNYFDNIGTVWIQEQGWYYDVPATGAIFCDSTAPSGWAGWYFDR